jgi:colanic acid/amylovoran biosynthesis glycosyltransferase
VNQRTPGQRRIAYLIGTYPVLTTTFIDRELRELQRRGLSVHVLSLRRPTHDEAVPGIAAAAANTSHLLPVAGSRFILDQLFFLATRPLRYLSTLACLGTRPHPSFRSRLKTMLHFLEGVCAARRLAAYGVDRCHVHFVDRAAVVGIVVSRLLRIPYSLSIHAGPDIFVEPILLAEKLDEASFVVTCTGFNKRYLENALGHRADSKIEVLYHGIELDQQPERVPSRAEPKLILSIGQLRERKGFAHLIQACHLLRSDGQDFACEIIGSGPQHGELQSLIDELDLDGTVVLRGSLPHAEVLGRLDQASAFALGCVVARDNNRDGIPNVLLEAMAAGVPVVSTRISAIPELVRDGENGLLVPPGDDEALAGALARLLRDPELAARLGEAGRQTVERDFDVRRNAERLYALLSE